MSAPDRIWVTQEDHGASLSGSFRVFRASNLDHGDNYPQYIRADLVIKLLADAYENGTHDTATGLGEALAIVSNIIQPPAS